MSKVENLTDMFLTGWVGLVNGETPDRAIKDLKDLIQAVVEEESHKRIQCPFCGTKTRVVWCLPKEVERDD
jgi:hypothetical protein